MGLEFIVIDKLHISSLLSRQAVGNFFVYFSPAPVLGSCGRPPALSSTSELILN